jgi:hypothetical protein
MGSVLYLANRTRIYTHLCNGRPLHPGGKSGIPVLPPFQPLTRLGIQLAILGTSSVEVVSCVPPLMIGAMMESRLATSAAAHFVAGLGGFRFVDLDTPMLLAEDPFTGGYEQRGGIYDVSGVKSGLGIERNNEAGR